MRLAPGDPAPSFRLLDQHGSEVALDGFAGRPLLVYFYPEADTPGCTTQACDVRDHRAELTDLGLAVVGISPDDPAAQLAFDEKFSLGFPLLSDPDHAVSTAWGTWGEKQNYGRTYIGMIRSAFLVDEQGRIEQAWYRVQAARMVPRVNAVLAAR
jgi:peroxiredoxin Q/BCP